MTSSTWSTAHGRVPPPPPAPDERRSWRERLPEIIATIGAALVALAVTGFLSSTWDAFGSTEKAMVLGGAAAGLTALGLWADRSRRPLELVVSLCWATATLLVAGAVTLAASDALSAATRGIVAAGGLAAALHAAFLLARRRDSLLQQAALAAALLYAAGPPGTAMSDRWSWGAVETLLVDPIWGLFDPTHTVEAFVITGIAYALIAMAWAALARVLSGRAAALARALSIAIAAFAALQLNVLASPVGAVGALAIVIGFLVYGLVAEDAALVAAGSVGCLVAGVRVLAALFSGAALVTALVFTGGLGMLAWAFWAMRHRERVGASHRGDATGS